MNVVKSSRVISRLRVELKTNVSETGCLHPQGKFQVDPETE